MPDQTYAAIAAHADSVFAMTDYSRLAAIRRAFSVVAGRAGTAREHLIVARLMA